ncbi:MAG: hypothetical protein J1F67_11340 [Muribaculaceae bacterium]|nr:hypothetical protein [Muribaculaceae bacterium]
MNYKACKVGMALIAIIFSACDDREISRESEENSVMQISVSAERYWGESVEVRSEDPFYVAPDASLAAYTVEFNENSSIFVSQITETVNPYMSDDAIYRYKFSETTGTNWANGFNFEPYDDDNAIEWSGIQNMGSFKNGYGLYAMYYNDFGENEEFRYSVEEDQSNIENLRRSDVMGAFHSTLSLYTRLRFRLFHLMTYLRVRLYVPEWGGVENNTGYPWTSYESATIMDATNEFSINWAEKRSSDSEGPQLKKPDKANFTPKNIKMYLSSDIQNDEVKEIKYTDFIPQGFVDQEIKDENGNPTEFDKVKVYDFHAVIPLQDKDFTSGNFLKFTFLNPVTLVPKNYYFSAGQNGTTDNSTLNLEQGNFQYLELYLPRKGDQAIFIKATVNPWTGAKSEMVLNPKE